MSTSKNKAAVRRFYEEVINKKNYAVIPELIATKYIFHMTPEIKGPEGVKNYFATGFTAFPDYHVKIDYMVAEGDLVATFATSTATFTNKWGDIAPTGKKASYQDANLCRLEGGKQVEVWGFTDTLDVYRKFGITLPKE